MKKFPIKVSVVKKTFVVKSNPKPQTPVVETEVPVVPVKSVTLEKFKTAVRSALKTCPRMPTAEICGYGGLNSIDKTKNICLLPTGHRGPHMHVDPAEIAESLPRKLVLSCPIKIDFSKESIPQEMTDILYAWRKIGNPWATSLEVELTVFSKGIKLENKVDNLPAINALAYLGYLDRQEPGRTEFAVRYRLSKKGLAATTQIAKLTGDSKPDVALYTEEVEELEEIDCIECDGDGILDGVVCDHCEGTGTEPPKKVRRRVVSLPEKKPPFRKRPITDLEIERTSSVIRGTPVKLLPKKLVDCIPCRGNGIIKGKVCSYCKGEGEMEVDTNDKGQELVRDEKWPYVKIKPTTSLPKKFTVRRGK